LTSKPSLGTERCFIERVPTGTADHENVEIPRCRAFLSPISGRPRTEEEDLVHPLDTDKLLGDNLTRQKAVRTSSAKGA
jgi:hypothetical protein